MSDSVWNQFREDGFYLFKGFFSQGQVEQVRQDAKSVFIRQMLNFKIVSSSELSESEFEAGMRRFFQQELGAFINCGKTCQHLTSLHRLSLDSKLLGQLRKLGVEQPNICTRPVLYFNSPHLAKSEVHHKTPPHQDWRSMQGSLNAMVVWLPLIDVTEELGALRVVPKSHTAGLLDSEKDEWFRKISVESGEFVDVEVEQGDALFFSAFLVHESGSNVTDRIRWSCHFRYNDLAEPTFIGRNFPNPYTYAPQQELVTDAFPSREVLADYFGVQKPRVG